jgi:hypothetical protein
VTDANKTLSQHVNNAPKVIESIFSNDRILWSKDIITVIPSQLVDDPLVSSLVKYYSSVYFIEKQVTKGNKTRAKKSLELLINSVLLPIGRTSENVLFNFIKEVRTQISNTDGIVWSYFTSLTPPIFLLGGHGRTSHKKLPELLARVSFTEEELNITRRICLKSNRPHLKPPENGSKKDIINYLDLALDGQEVIVSLRLFTAWYIIEWSKIRKCIHERCPDKVDQLKKYISQNPKQRDQKILKQRAGDPKNINCVIDIIFNIVKAVNNPMLTERFASGYLALQKKQRSRAIMDLYDFEKHESQATATAINFIREIESHHIYTNGDKAHYKRKLTGKLVNLKSHTKRSNYWEGAVSNVMSIPELLGITPEEEICFAWLLSTDRHQTSNIARMLPDDIEETTNTLSTMMNPQSIKFRSRTIAGIPYSDGQQYKKNGTVFEALKAYKEQIKRSYAEGYFDCATQSRTDGPILPRISINNDEPSLALHYFRIHKSNQHSLQLLLCSIPGSLSNAHATQANPAHQVWFDVLKAIATSALSESRSKSLSCDLIQRQAVNNMLKFSVSSSSIPLSNDNELAVISEKLEYQQKIEASNHNHSSTVRSEIYLDRAPNSVLLASSTRFGARVGDEMIRMGIPLAERMASTTQALTIAEARRLLCLETLTERDSAASTEVNLVLEQAKLQDYIVDEIGIATGHGQSIILKTPLTTALIQAKIKHIDNCVDSLLASNDTRADNIIAHRLYLQLILDEFFSKNEIEDANLKYGGYEFPMNDLLV